MKYNWSIIGHEKQLKMIERDLETNNLSHAYLLAGPNSVGKHTVASKLANILQCENDFCHTCSTCIQLKKGSHIDTIELHDNKDSIKIEDIRKLIERLSMTKQSKYKVLIIQSIERMTTEAANSFLKILEEPSPGTVFILTTNNIHIVLPTIISRVRVIKFGNASFEYLSEKLHKLYPDSDEETIKKVCIFAMGKTGKAVHLMEHPESLADYLHVYNEVQELLNENNVSARFAYVDQLSEDQDKLDLFFSMLTHVLRSRMLEGGFSEAKKRYVDDLIAVDKAGFLLRKNVNLRLVLENLLLNL